MYMRTNSWLLLILLLRRFILDGSIGASKKTRGRTRPFRLNTRLEERILLHFSKFVRFSDVDYYFFFLKSISISLIDDYFRRYRLNFM